jgi:G-protein alpha subunit
MMLLGLVAPLSCFDERLVEDSRINRLEDSFLLWRTVCSSKLLEKTSLILFMNKIDLLKKKIKVRLPFFRLRRDEMFTSIGFRLGLKSRDTYPATAIDRMTLQPL